jgi:DNA-binding NarL/FixJ family response regulator
MDMQSTDTKPNSSNPPILALVRDLMFSSRITAEARAVSANIKIIRDPTALESADPTATLLLIDLNLPGATDAAAHWQSQSPTRTTIGFASHEDTPTISQARSAGIHQVLARSRFVQILPQLLSQK